MYIQFHLLLTLQLILSIHIIIFHMFFALQHSRSSERLRNKKKFVMPKKDVIWRDIQSTEKTKLRTPSKCVNDFTKM